MTADITPLILVKYSPKWVPFQRFADHGRKMIEKMVTTPYERVKAELVRSCRFRCTWI